MKKLSLKKITQKLSDNPKAQLSIDLFFLGLSIVTAVNYANEGKSVFVGLLCFFAGLIGFSINVNLEKIIKKEGEKNA
ncbi:hypothetical protein PDM92_21375 [Bacillus cereus]|nr:hypothetical protein [Bacillus cereus]